MKQHLLHLQEKLAGRSLPVMSDMLNVLAPYIRLFHLLRDTITRSETSICWLMGPWQSGKKTLLQKVLRDLAKTDSHYTYKMVDLMPEQCASTVSAIATLYAQIIDPTEQQPTLQSNDKLEQVLEHIAAPNKQPLLIHIQRFTRVERDHQRLMYALLDTMERSTLHPICLIASDIDVVM